MNNKPVIGISCGDINGIGIELIIKTFTDGRLYDFCTPVVFATNKVINFYKKSLPDININSQAIKDLTKLNPRQLNIFTSWEEDVEIKPGELTDEGGKYAVKSLKDAVEALKAAQIDALVTLPIHKKSVQSPEFNYTGHTPFLKDTFNAPDVVMLLCSGDLRVAVVTEHVPVNEISKHITKESVYSKLAVLNDSLIKDFGIIKPKIAVLGLNPHAGDEGVIGKEEKEIIEPAIKEARRNQIMAIGPFSADAFFAKTNYQAYDAVLAMYHDQGLIPFKTIAFDTGVNYTAGLPVVRTSPDHGVAFDIAGKNIAEPSSFLAAIFLSLDVIKNRSTYKENNQNPMKKINKEVFDRMADEEIRE